MDNIPIDKKMLGKWLAAGYIEKGKRYPTEKGTPQGSPISPTLLVIALSGLEKAVKAATRPQDKVNVCVYADDFIITGVTPEVLEDKVKPTVEAFLAERGLSFAQDKTRVTHISDGFDFLGFNIRKYNGKLLIKPAKSSVKRFLAEIRRTIKRSGTVKTEELINRLNPKITGFCNYYRHACSKATFAYIDYCIYKALWVWCVRRHRTPSKGSKWIKHKYFRGTRSQNWVFSALIKGQKKNVYLDLREAGKTSIKRHVKIRAEAIPYDPLYHDYFDKRVQARKPVDKDKPCKQATWWLCWWKLFKPKEASK